MLFAVAAVLVALDQASKVWAVAAFPLGGPGRPLIPGAVDLTYVQNTGAAFGMLRGVDLRLGPLHVDGTFLLGLLSLAVSVWLVQHLARHGRDHGRWMRAALTMILAGAVGNMIDRFRLGYVIDMIHVNIGWFDFPVFNLADALISVGAVLLLVVTLAAPSSPASSSPSSPAEAARRAGRADPADRAGPGGDAGPAGDPPGGGADPDAATGEAEEGRRA
jgi:signal peptidase II